MPIPSAPPEPAFADDDADDRRADLAHGLQVLGDDRGLTALLGGDSRIGTGRVDERDDRQTDTCRRSAFS